MNSFEVLTSRLRLRPQQVADAEAALQIDSLPEVRRHLNSPLPLPLSELQELYAAGVAAWNENKAFYLVLEDRETLAYWGGLGIRFPRHPQLANLGYILSPEVWGQGLMTEAVATACYLAFQDRQAVRVDAQVQVGNFGSRRLLEKCGFQRDGTLRTSTQVNGAWRDEWFMTFTREDWKATGEPGAPAHQRGRLGTSLRD